MRHFLALSSAFIAPVFVVSKAPTAVAQLVIDVAIVETALGLVGAKFQHHFHIAAAANNGDVSPHDSPGLVRVLPDGLGSTYLAPHHEHTSSVSPSG
jgi:hypothetical protein